MANCPHRPLSHQGVLGALAGPVRNDTPAFVRLGELLLYACVLCGEPYWGNGEAIPFRGLREVTETSTRSEKHFAREVPE